MYYKNQIAQNIKSNKIHELFVKEFKHIELIDSRDLLEFTEDWKDVFKGIEKIMNKAKENSVNFTELNF